MRSDRNEPRWLAGPLGALLAITFLTASLAAQERTAITIDYVGVEGIYLPAGSDEGLAVGDTLAVYSSETIDAPLGWIELASVTRRRSVATMLVPAFALERGDVVYLSLPAIEEVAALTRLGELAPARTGAVVRPAAGGRGPRISGRLALDVEGRETRTSWEGDLFGETRRRFATPVARLSLTASDLGGGFSLQTSLRASYRYSDVTFGAPTTSVRAYELAVINDFGSRPVELRLGRFHNPYESYSAYWDGMLLRVGGRKGGVGVVAGFEPSRYNEGIATDLPKLTGFANVAVGGRGWRYDSDVSAHLLRPDTGPDRTYAGWSQRLALGPLSLSQRVQVAQPTDGSAWSLEQLRLRGAVEVFGPLQVQGGYARMRPSILVAGLATFADLREEITVGGSLLGQRGALSADVGTTRREGEPQGRSVTAAANVRSGGVLLLASGRYWTRSGQNSLGLSPGLGFGLGPLDLRWGYQFYRTHSSASELTSHAGDLRLGMTLLSGLRLTLRGQQQWGSNFMGTRIQMGIWRSF